MDATSLDFEMTLDDCKQAMAIHGRRGSPQPKVYRQMIIVGYATVAFGVMLFGTRFDGGGWIAPAALIAIGLFIPIRLTLFGLQHLEKEWRGSQHLLQPVRWEFCDEEVRITSPLFSGTYRWNCFTTSIEGQMIFLIYQSESRYQIIPKRAFAGKPELVAFRRLLAEKLQVPVRGFPVSVISKADSEKS